MRLKLNIFSFIKYWFVKILATSLLFAISNQQEYQGVLIYIALTVYSTTISVCFIYIFYMITGFFFLRQSFRFMRILFFFVTLVVINDFSCLLVEKNTDIISAMASGKPWQIIYKACDFASLILSSYLFLWLPIRKKSLALNLYK